MKLSNRILFVLLIGSNSLLGQNYTTQCELADQLFPDADKVTLYKNCSFYVTREKDTIKVTSTNKEVNYIRKNSTLYQKESIYYSAEFSGIKKIMAYTIDRSKSKKTKFAGSAEAMYFSSHIFYDDNRERYFVYPDVEDNVITEMEYTMDYFEPRLIPTYYFSFIDPVIHSSVTITFPDGCDIGWIAKDQGKYKIEMEKKRVKGMNEYTWKLENAKILNSPTTDVSASKVLPHLILWIRSYQTDHGKKHVLNDIGDLYTWYNGFVNKAAAKDTGLIKSTSDSITKNMGSSLQKVSEIFKWVQNNISYVAIEDGYSGFIPRKADDVIKKKYGDCKDMANLLVELIRNCGIDARHVWIGTRDIPYTYHEVYTPIVDNHMIAAVKLDDQFYFLDATGRFMPFGFPTSMIQGKVALVEKSANEFELIDIDVPGADKNIMVDSITLQITDNKLHGSGIYSLSGYPMIDFKISESYSSNASERQYYKDLLLKGNNKFKLNNYELLDKTKMSDKMRIGYSFEMSDYISVSNDELYINMNIGKTGLYSFEKKEINQEAYSNNDYNYMKEDHFVLSIPPGFKVAYVPADNNIEHDFVSYSNKYDIIDDKLVFHRRLVVNFLQLNGDQLSRFNSIVSDIQKIERSNVLLKKLN